MAASLPNALKAANITPFVVRAAQVEKAKPIIAYWCMYFLRGARETLMMAI